MIERLCECGEDLSHRHINTKQCADCSIRKNREKNKISYKNFKDKGIKRDGSKYYKKRHYSLVD